MLIPPLNLKESGKNVSQQTVCQLVQRIKQTEQLPTLHACAQVSALLQGVSGLHVLHIHDNHKPAAIAHKDRYNRTLHGQTPEQQETSLATGA